jgi:Eukaryotic translation initiation factor eIF2A
LAEAERWLAERPDGLNEAEWEFIETSVALREQERAAREWLRRRNRIIALAVIGIVSIAALFAGWQWWQAEEQRNLAEAQKLAAPGDAVFAESSRYLDTSALLAVESTRLQPLLENDGLLRATLTLLPKQVVRVNHEGPIRDVYFSSDSRYVATASDDKSARIFETATGKEVARLTHEDAVVGVQFSSDSRYVATASDDKSARIFEAATGKEIARLIHEGAVSSVQFSPDGRYVATRSVDNSARIFEAATGKEIARLNHEHVVSSVRFSPDGRYVATGSEDGRARVFQAATGREIARVSREGRVWSVQFSPDGRSLRSLVLTSGSLGVYSDLLVPQDLVVEACWRLTRNLTTKEWKTYFPDAPYHKTCPEIP